MSFEYQQIVVGKEGITAKIVADSISESGKRITTFELEYPRWILAELNTHRQFSRNSMSSRAIPVNKQIQQIIENPATPVFWGLNQSGMSAKEEHSNIDACKGAWKAIAEGYAAFADVLKEQNLHKQIVNRLLEPFQRMKTVLTATEFDNFFKLRLAPDAQPEIQELARCMKEVMNKNTPEVLKEGEWHTPYVNHWRDDTDNIMYGLYIDKGQDHYPIKWLTTEEALSVSTSCCAQVSYRSIDNSYDKAMDVYTKLGLNTEHSHLSPAEHQGTPIVLGNDCGYPTYPKGVTAIEPSKDIFSNTGKVWSGNFDGWIQHRQLIELK